ncbi:hypothetical protein [Bullifex porci]|uniref:hypothetical protein n=1 Tax=Bullifex porci TaxID=2606638 RepID=UPI0023F04501|nr:hypothetical protein [Bullifex porci]MDD7255633.1 hypothetical protein [Bullifex porci]
MEEVVTLKLERYDKLVSELDYFKGESADLEERLFALRDKVNDFAIRYIKENAKPALKEATVDELMKTIDLNQYIYLGDLDYLKLLLDEDEILSLLIKIRKEQTNEADQ